MTRITSEQHQQQPDLVLSLYSMSGTILVAMATAVNKIDKAPVLTELEYTERKLSNETRKYIK